MNLSKIIENPTHKPEEEVRKEVVKAILDLNCNLNFEQAAAIEKYCHEEHQINPGYYSAIMNALDITNIIYSLEVTK